MKHQIMLLVALLAAGCPQQADPPKPCSCPRELESCQDDCGEGKTCYEPLGMCTRTCRVSQDCPDPMDCKQGLCVTRCDHGKPCPPGTKCSVEDGPEGPSGEVCVYDPPSSTNTDTNPN